MTAILAPFTGETLYEVTPAEDPAGLLDRARAAQPAWAALERARPRRPPRRRRRARRRR